MSARASRENSSVSFSFQLFRKLIAVGFPYVQAQVWAMQGEKSKAIAMLEEPLPSFGRQIWLDKDPLFEVLRNDEGFINLVKKLKAETDALKKKSQEMRSSNQFPTIDLIQRNQ
jgi:hypothetical protein